MELLCQGAEGRILKGSYLGRTAVVKERFVKKYRHPELDDTMTKERMRAEARALVKCRAAGLKVPVVYFVDFVNRCLVLEYFEGSVSARTRIECLQQSKDDAGLNSLVQEIGRAVSTMHRIHLIHGDLTTSNIMVLEDGTLGMIDFGLSHTEASPEDKGVDLYVLERAFLSSHPNTQHLFTVLLDSYKSSYGREADPVLNKLEEIRLRGRKRTMVG